MRRSYARSLATVVGTTSAHFASVVSVLHEVLVDLFRESPELVVQLLRPQLPYGIVPVFRLGETTFSQLTEVDADLVLEATGPDGTPAYVLIIEVQLSIKPDKPGSWVAYQAGAHRRYGCPTYVVVVTIDPAVAAWAAGPFDTGQTTFRPIVVGPAQVPPIVDLEVARDNLYLTVLSGLAHHDEPVAEAIGQALWHSLDHNDPNFRDLYWDLFLRTVGEATRKSLEMLFSNYVPQSEWGKKHYAAGEAEALLVLLEARGLAVSPGLRARVADCTDTEQLRAWLQRAATATETDQVFLDD